MPNDDDAVRAISPGGKVDATAPPEQQLLYEQEIASLRATISELTGAIEAHAQEKLRLQAAEALVQQLRDANQHLVLATFDARDLHAAAEAANLRQVEFLSMLAHELRNPLQPMEMAAKLLAGHVGLHPAIAKVHAIYSRQISHMVRLVDDLLDASRVSSGKITLQLAPVLLSDIIDDAVETSLPGIDRRHQRLQVRLPATPVTIEGDLVRLAQVFSNLLVNASKFTQEFGHIDIAAQHVGDTVEVSVSDDGAGIPPDLLPFVFDLFTQGYRSLERAQGGLGIGLSLVRSLTQLHGGSATVVSEGAGKGSKFIIVLPLSASPKTVPDSGAPAAVLPIRPCNILLIEDNVDANDVMTMVLQQDGHTVTSCFDGPSGLRAGLDHPFDVVLCDIGLPGMDGFQVVSAMRAALAPPHPCFIATTGYNTTGQMDRASEAGFDHYLVKPVNLASLTRLIATHATPLRAGAGRRDSTTASRPKKY
ncbi:MAG: hybrid sensor histidine kinase/response regulator [Massilia sp.]|nr:hybrid sensor histidine kinase/response regulator [Massilia sp.]